MFRVVSPPIIRGAHNCIYSILHLSNHYCYLPLSWKNWNSSTIAAGSSNGLQVPDAVDTVVCAPDDGWRYHSKHVEQFPDTAKLCNVASCWIYMGMYLRCTDPWMLNQLEIIHISLSPFCLLLFMGLSHWEGKNISCTNEDIHHLIYYTSVHYPVDSTPTLAHNPSFPYNRIRRTGQMRIVYSAMSTLSVQDLAVLTLWPWKWTFK